MTLLKEEMHTSVHVCICLQRFHTDCIPSN